MRFRRIGTQLFGGCKTILDVKTKTCDSKYPSAFDLFSADAKVSAVVDKRATQANRVLLTRARKLDADLGTPAETMGHSNWNSRRTFFDFDFF